jgi:N-acetyl-alpha-D-muramate 1-phosphate uridylyltransferase
MLTIAILCGGLGTRLAHETQVTPKSLVMVAGRPFIEYQLDLLQAADYTRVVFCVGHLADQIEQHLRQWPRPGMEYLFSYDAQEKFGPAAAICQALPLLDEQFAVMYGDSWLNCDYQAIEKDFLSRWTWGLMAVCHPAPRDLPNIQVRGGRVIDCAAGYWWPVKPTHIDYGLSYFQALGWRNYGLHLEGRELSAFHHALVLDAWLAAYEVPGRYWEIGSLDGLTEFREYMESKK